MTQKMLVVWQGTPKEFNYYPFFLAEDPTFLPCLPSYCILMSPSKINKVLVPLYR